MIAEYVNNIHRARVNIGWYLASAIWPEVRTVDRVHIICRAAGEANIDEVNRAHRGPYHELNISRYSRTRGEYCTYTWKCETKASFRRPCFASAWNCSACTVVRCGRTDLIDLFPAAFVNSQIAQVESLRILERVIPVSSSLCGEVFVTSPFFFFSKLRT